MDINYHDHLPADHELRRLVDCHANLLDACLDAVTQSPRELHVYVTYDLRDDRYRVQLEMRVEHETCRGYGEQLQRLVAISAAFQDLHRNVDDFIASRIAKTCAST
jgi:hypothetical protein